MLQRISLVFSFVSIPHAAGSARFQDTLEQDNRCRHDQHYRQYGNHKTDPFPASSWHDFRSGT